MSKPLELIVYPADANGVYWKPGFDFTVEPTVREYCRNYMAGPVALDRLVKFKRLSGSELAAEMWKLTYDGEYAALMLEEFRSTPGRTKSIRYWADEIGINRERAATMYRFTTLPHHDEVQP